MDISVEELECIHPFLRDHISTSTHQVARPQEHLFSVAQIYDNY